MNSAAASFEMRDRFDVRLTSSPRSIPWFCLLLNQDLSMICCIQLNVDSNFGDDVQSGTRSFPLCRFAHRTRQNGISHNNRKLRTQLATATQHDVPWLDSHQHHPPFSHNHHLLLTPTLHDCHLTHSILQSFLNCAYLISSIDPAVLLTSKLDLPHAGAPALPCSPRGSSGARPSVPKPQWMPWLQGIQRHGARPLADRRPNSRRCTVQFVRHRPAALEAPRGVSDW